MALPSLKHGKRHHIPLGPPGTTSHRTGCTNNECCCEEESIMQNMCNKRNERLNKPCQNGFCYCYTSDSDGIRKGPSTSTGHHRCKGVRKEYTYNLPTESDCSEVVTSDQYFADKEKEKKKKRVSLPPDFIESTSAQLNGTAGCNHKDGKCSKDKCRRRPFQATNKFKEFHCSDSDAPLIHIIQEVQRNTVVSEIRINRSKLKKSKARSKSASRAGENIGGSRGVPTSDKIINTENVLEFDGRNGNITEKLSYKPEGKDAGTNTHFPAVPYLTFKQQTNKTTNNMMSPSEDDDSKSDLSSAKPKSHKSKGGRLLLKRIGPDVAYRPSVGPPRKPPRNFSSSSDCSSLASEQIKISKHTKRKNRSADTSVTTIGDQPTMIANFPLPHDTDGSGNGKDNFKNLSNNSLNSLVSQKPKVTKDTFDKVSARVGLNGDRTSICTSEGGYSKPIMDALNIPNESFESGPSSRQEYVPTCPPYNEVVSPGSNDINELLSMLPNVPSGPVVINEPLNKLNINPLIPHPVEYAEINVIPIGDEANPEQVGWAPPIVYNMLNTATAKLIMQNPLVETQQVGWQAPPKLQIDTVDGAQQASENENANNLAANMELKSTPVKPDIPKEDLTPKNVLREKMKQLPQPPSKPVRQPIIPTMPTVLEMSHSGDDKTVVSFKDFFSDPKRPSVSPTQTSTLPTVTHSMTRDSTKIVTVTKPAESTAGSGTLKGPNNDTKEVEIVTKDPPVASKDPPVASKDPPVPEKDTTASKQSQDSTTSSKQTSAPAKESGMSKESKETGTPSAGKRFQKRALKHTKSFLESLGFSKKKDNKGANKQTEDPPPKMVETVGTQTNDAAVLQGRRLKFDYASDDTMERRSMTPIRGDDETSTLKPTHHSDDGFDFNRTVQSPKSERTSQRIPFSPRNFLKTLQPGNEKAAANDESYKSYASDLSEDLSVAVQDLLGKARTKLEGESFTTAPETVTNTLTDESVAACTISAQADVHPEPIYAEINEEGGMKRRKGDGSPKEDSDGGRVVYAKVVKKGGDKQPLSPHRPAPHPPATKQGKKSKEGKKSENGDTKTVIQRQKSDEKVKGKDNLQEESNRNYQSQPASPQPSTHSTVKKGPSTSQDKKSGNRPKQSPPPVPKESNSAPSLEPSLEPLTMFPTPPQHSPSHSRQSSSSHSSSRGAFSPHLDDFFSHGPLQEVDTGPFVERLSPVGPNVPNSSTNHAAENIDASGIHKIEPAPTRPKDASKRSKRNVIYENLPSDNIRQPKPSDQTPLDNASQDDFYSNVDTDVPNESEGSSSNVVHIRTRSARIDDPRSLQPHHEDTRSARIQDPRPGQPYHEDIRSTRVHDAHPEHPYHEDLRETRPHPSRDTTKDHGITSAGSHYPPLPDLQTTARASPQGQSSPDQDEPREVYGSVQPGASTGTQSFFSIQSDRFITPAGWHQSQPIAGGGQAQHTSHSVPRGWHHTQPIASNQGESHVQDGSSGNTHGYHQDKHSTDGKPPLPVRAPVQPGGRREHPQGSNQPGQSFSRHPDQETASVPIYPYVGGYESSDVSEGEYNRGSSRYYPVVSYQMGDSSDERHNGINQRSQPHGSYYQQRPLYPNIHPEGVSSTSNIPRSHRAEGIYPNIHQEKTSLSEGEKDRRYKERLITDDQHLHDQRSEVAPPLPPRRRRSTDDSSAGPNRNQPSVPHTDLELNRLLSDHTGPDRSEQEVRRHGRSKRDISPTGDHVAHHSDKPARSGFHTGQTDHSGSHFIQTDPVNQSEMNRFGRHPSQTDHSGRSNQIGRSGSYESRFGPGQTDSHGHHLNQPKRPESHVSALPHSGLPSSQPDRFETNEIHPGRTGHHTSQPAYTGHHANQPDITITHKSQPDRPGTNDGQSAHSGSYPSQPAHSGPHTSQPAHSGPHFSQPAHSGPNSSRPDSYKTHKSQPDHPSQTIRSGIDPSQPDRSGHHGGQPAKSTSHSGQPDRFETHKSQPDRTESHPSQPILSGQHPSETNHPGQSDRAEATKTKPGRSEPRLNQVDRTEFQPSQYDPPGHHAGQTVRPGIQPQSKVRQQDPVHVSDDRFAARHNQTQNIPQTPYTGQQPEFDYSSLPSPPQNISMGNPPVIEYGWPSSDRGSHAHDTESKTKTENIYENIPPHSIDAERPLTTSTPQPPEIREPVPSTSYNNSHEKDSPPKYRVLSKSDLSQASDIFLENLHQKNVNVTRHSDRSDFSDHSDHPDHRDGRSDHSDGLNRSNPSDQFNRSDLSSPLERSDDGKKSNLDSPLAISQFYYYDSSNGNGDSTNSSFSKDAGEIHRHSSQDTEFHDPCCGGENCRHLKLSGYDTVDFENQSPETISFKSCRSTEDKDENMNSSTSRDLNFIALDEKPTNKYENLKDKIRASIRRSKNYFKKKRSVLDRSVKSDNDTRSRNQHLLRHERKGESDFEVDYISALELLNETTKDASLKRQLEQTVSLCRKFPEFETSPEMVEAERLLLYTELKEKSTCKSNDSISSYRSTPKDFISGRICVTSFEIPIKPNIHHDAYFNYFYIGVFSHGQDIRSTQSAEQADDTVFFPNCNMLFNELNGDFEINVDLYVLRLRKLSSPPTQQDNVPVKIRKSSLTDSQEEVVSRFQMHGNYMIHATDLAPFEVKSDTENSVGSDDFYLVSNNIFALPINLFPRNINLTNEVWLTANACYKFKNFQLSGFLNVGEMNGKLNWNKRWCQIDALTLHFWNYPQECTEVEAIMSLDLVNCTSNTVQSANREICSRPKTFQLEMRKFTSGEVEDRDEDPMDVLFFSTESQEEYNYWVKGLNYALDFMRAWRVQVQ